MRIPYLDLSVKDEAHRTRLLDAAGRVLNHGRVVLGPEVEELEKRVGAYCGRRFCIGVSSGTDALFVALMALGIRQGDEVITTPLSWVATLNAIVLTGATPVFVDVGADLNLDHRLLEDAITDRTAAIVPVHFTGKTCEMDEITSVAKRFNIPIVEDAAQAFGAKFRGHRKAGSFGRLACFSFNAMKVLHSYGEAGAVLTDDENLAERLGSLRYAGTIDREDCATPSLNFRIHTLQAALLLVELDRLESIIARRRKIAAKYRNALSELVTCPNELTGFRHIFYTFTIQTERRDELRKHMENRGIETKIHHRLLMPHQSAYRGRFPLEIPVAEKVVQEILSIPNHEKLNDGEVDYIIESVSEFFG